MTLLTAHRILIGTAVAFFVYYGLWELWGFRAAGTGGGWIRGVASLAAAAALGLYIMTLGRTRKSGDRPGSGAAAGPRGDER